MKDIKRKQKETKKRTQKIKKAKTLKIKPTVSAVDKLKREYIRSKAELQRQTSEQTQRPENYAVDEVENKSEQAVYTVVDAIKQSTRYIRSKAHNPHTISQKETAVQEKISNQYTFVNTPKTKSQYEVVHKAASQRIEPRMNLRMNIKIKTKEEYLNQKASTKSRTYRLKSNGVYKAKEKIYNIKTLQMLRNNQKKLQNNKLVDKTNDARKYIQNKLKTKEKIPQTVENRNVHISHASIHGNIISKKEESSEQVKTVASNIKTKQNYIQSHVYDGASNRGKKLQSAGIPKKSAIKSRAEVTVKNDAKQTYSSEKGKSMPKTKNYASQKRMNNHSHVKKQAAKQTVKRSRQLAQRSIQISKETTKAVVRFSVKIVQAIAIASKEIASAIVALGGWAVLIVVLIMVIVIAAIAASPFGIFISEEVIQAGIIPLSQIIAEYNVELTQEIENIELTIPHTAIEISDNRTDSNIVIAVFAAKLAGAEDNTAEDVVVFDTAKVEKLKSYFRTANIVEYEVTEKFLGEDEVETILTIAVTGKTKDEMMDEYSLTAKQREAVETLLEYGNILTSTSQSLAISDADVQKLINNLPEDILQTRKDVVKNAGSLVGKVNYFWGGKSSVIGWDELWGTMQKVTAAGSPSSGTIRAYGLDCSGFITWVFHNSGIAETAIGHGTSGQKSKSAIISVSEVQAGDLAFFADYSHVGIVAGKDSNDNILVIHCSSGANNVVLSTASSAGFTVFRRPNCY